MNNEKRTRDVLAAVKPGQYEPAIKQALDILHAPTETEEMKKLRDEARRLGEESDRLHGDRNLGYFKLDPPLRNISGEIDLLEEAQSAKSDEDKKAALESVIELTNKRTSGGRRD
jgi:light-regulated signal transduction histidine kinase (bacteriophytochrome)